jgi:cyclophilin family peptidyl-prolyl cis-trans isomerase
MFVALSIGILTALTGTALSQVAPVFADKGECKNNDDKNCNETTHKIKQDNDCKVKNEYEKIRSMGATTNNNQFICTNVLTSPANGDHNAFGDTVFGQSIPSP